MGVRARGCTATQVQTDAVQWVRRVRDSNLEGRFLHVSAAGNIYPDLLTDTQAALGAAFNYAALRPLPGNSKPDEHHRGGEHHRVGSRERTRGAAVPHGHLQARGPHLNGR